MRSAPFNTFLINVSLFLFGVCIIPPNVVTAQEKELANGSFQDWADGLPTGWAIGKGAGTANAPKSTVAKSTDGSLELSGDKSTLSWTFLSQKLNVNAGQAYQLDVLAKANGIKLEPGQNNNCYVGVFSKNGQGKIIGQTITTIESPDYSKTSLYFQAPAQAAKSEVWIFLSKTGTLNVKKLSVSETNDFDSLVGDMDRNYSYFEHKKVDWKELTDKYRDKAQAAKAPAKFAKLVNEMLLELKDMHVWVTHDGKQLQGFNVPAKPNYDFNSIIPGLKEKQIVNRICLTGKTKDGFGYVLIESMNGLNDKVFNQVAGNIKELFDTKGIIVDLRPNKGGDERIGQKIAGMFCEQKQLYAKQKVRSGPKHSDFTESMNRSIVPWRHAKGDKAFTKPIICLQGPRAVSSAEGFTLMMKSLPNCTTVGLPTRGASGNPSPIKLSNGVEVWYSRWVAMDSDGEPIEGVGIQPDVVVQPAAKGDSTFEQAIELLKEATK